MFWRILIMTMAVLLTQACTKRVDLNERVLNLVVPSDVKGFDPVQASDRYSNNEIAKVYETLYQYSYLKRPYELEPALADGMPQVSKDGLTYTVKVKKGVFFQDNECFPEGKGRELTAHDLIYSIKRLADPRTQSLGWWVLDGKIKGFNEWKEIAQNADVTDYSLEVEGLKATDDHTIVFKLTEPFPQFLYALAMPFTSAVPKEAVIYYGTEFLNNPVGTGPFITGKYSQSKKIVYTKNPNFREEYYPSEGESSDEAAGFLKDKGKRLPLVDKIVVSIQTEDQPRWLAFEKGRVDFVGVPKDNFGQVVTPDQGMSDRYKSKGIRLDISPDLDVTYTAFNFDNELLAGNVYLRRAMSLATDTEKINELFYNGTAIVAQGIIPPGIAGYRGDLVNPYQEYNVEKAKEMMVKAGYPEGKGLPKIKYDTVASTVSRQMGELFRAQMQKIGIEIDVISNTWPELVKKVNTRQTMTYGMAWGADYPDAENFLSLLYGPNSAPGSNGANYNDPVYNKKFEEAKIMQHSPERTKRYEELNQYIIDQSPWIIGFHRTSFTVIHGWLENYKFTSFDSGIEKYLNVNIEKKKELYDKL